MTEQKTSAKRTKNAAQRTGFGAIRFLRSCGRRLSLEWSGSTATLLTSISSTSKQSWPTWKMLSPGSNRKTESPRRENRRVIGVGTLSATKVSTRSKQWELVLEIRQKLTEYHSAILQYSQIALLRQPTGRQRRAMFDIIRSASRNDSLGQFRSLDLGGVGGPRAYGRQHSHDLILLESQEEENDALSRLLVQPLLTMFHFF
ncbi:Uu.00g004240.m01.CDS01 [Anthostomella pinea]|uniref:Uu.00g004240.m01.CDS01 n=1 Tax=Anthostomella pinea TaxID=933095 RepID=A0AAI8VJU4_9PEZI|nr:Uu.00g004240.m01.CDS01 [Anthostomella pinea]